MSHLVATERCGVLLAGRKSKAALDVIPNPTHRTDRLTATGPGWDRSLNRRQ
jgi:hypothetical protein